MRGSDRGFEMVASPIRRLLPHARVAKKKGVKVYHLNIGQPDIPTPPSALENIASISEDTSSYGPSEGLPKLRSKVAEYYNEFEGDIQMDNMSQREPQKEYFLHY